LEVLTSEQLPFSSEKELRLLLGGQFICKSIQVTPPFFEGAKLAKYYVLPVWVAKVS
jgi:hypothetical protein